MIDKPLGRLGYSAKLLPCGGVEIVHSGRAVGFARAWHRSAVAVTLGGHAGVLEWLKSWCESRKAAGDPPWRNLPEVT